MNIKLKRLLFVIFGTLFLGIGIVGIFIPVLPTTPLLLLAASFYARGSKKFYDWLLNNRIIGPYLRHYIDGRGMPLKIKLFTIGLLWTAISLTVIFAVEGFWVRSILVLVAVAVSIHIALIKGEKSRKSKNSRKYNT
jgi:uncharacterized membrane protein YbaN (DUF454 family)